MVVEIRDTRGDTGKGAGGGGVPETWRDRTTGTAHDSVTDEVVTLLGDRTEITVEAELHEGEMATTPTPLPPNQDRQRIQGGGQNCRDGGRLE